MEDEIFPSTTDINTLIDEVVDDTNEVNEAEEAAFLTSVLGPEAAAEAPVSQEVREAYEPEHNDLGVTYTTKGGKDILVGQKETGKYFIKFVPGGELPPELKGEFTVQDLAHQAVRTYLARQE